MNVSENLKELVRNGDLQSISEMNIPCLILGPKRSFKEIREKLGNYLDVLKEHEEDLNNINVFPIMDKDTGTNLRKTLDFELPKTDDAKEFLHALTEKVLYNARGSSGNILALYLLGLDNTSKTFGSYELATRFKLASEFVWDNIYNPQEGTMLTLMKSSPNIDGDFYVFLEKFIDNCVSSLMEGPDLLPILKEKNTLDSGSLGFIFILCGIYKCLTGIDRTPHIILNNIVDVEENKDVEFRYCVEGLLHSYNREELLKILRLSGDELIVMELKDYINRDTLKFHVHTSNWEKIEDACYKYGKPINFKVEDMVENNKVLRN